MGERSAVIGIGQTKLDARRIDVSQVGLVREAAKRALEDAELDWRDIDVALDQWHVLHREYASILEPFKALGSQYADVEHCILKDGASAFSSMIELQLTSPLSADKHLLHPQARLDAMDRDAADSIGMWMMPLNFCDAVWLWQSAEARGDECIEQIGPAECDGKSLSVQFDVHRDLQSLGQIGECAAPFRWTLNANRPRLLRARRTHRSRHGRCGHRILCRYQCYR